MRSITDYTVLIVEHYTLPGVARRDPGPPRAKAYCDAVSGATTPGIPDPLWRSRSQAAPMAALRCGILPEGDQAEWFDDDPREALSRALAWDEGRIAAQVKSATSHSWRHWSRILLETLQCGESS